MAALLDSPAAINRAARVTNGWLPGRRATTTSGPRSRSLGITPARTNELLPTPEGPTTGSTGTSLRRSTTAAISASRPKKVDGAPRRRAAGRETGGARGSWIHPRPRAAPPACWPDPWRRGAVVDPAEGTSPPAGPGPQGRRAVSPVRARLRWSPAASAPPVPGRSRGGGRPTAPIVSGPGPRHPRRCPHPRRATAPGPCRPAYPPG